MENRNSLELTELHLHRPPAINGSVIGLRPGHPSRPAAACCPRRRRCGALKQLGNTPDAGEGGGFWNPRPPVVPSEKVGLGWVPCSGPVILYLLRKPPGGVKRSGGGILSGPHLFRSPFFGGGTPYTQQRTGGVGFGSPSLFLPKRSVHSSTGQKTLGIEGPGSGTEGPDFGLSLACFLGHL